MRTVPKLLAVLAGCVAAVFVAGLVIYVVAGELADVEQAKHDRERDARIVQLSNGRRDLAVEVARLRAQQAVLVEQLRRAGEQPFVAASPAAASPPSSRGAGPVPAPATSPSNGGTPSPPAPAPPVSRPSPPHTTPQPADSGVVCGLVPVLC